MTNKDEKISDNRDLNYIKHGSDQHAALIGLKKAEEDDVLAYRGYTLVDITMFGPGASKAFLQAVLKQKVESLLTPVPMPQSEDHRQPNYAPRLFVPDEAEREQGPTPDEIEFAMDILRRAQQRMR